MKTINRGFTLLLLILTAFSVTASAQQISKFYVAPNGSDSNNGSIGQPFASIKRAMAAVTALNQSGLKNDVQVIFRKGVYQVTNTLKFDAMDGGDATHSVTYMAYPGEKVIISGGRRLTGNWVKESDHVWKYNIGVPESEKTVFRSLYANDKRLTRSHSPNLYTVGVLPQYSHSFKMGQFDSKNLAHLKRDSIECFAGFTYRKGDLRGVSQNSSAELILFGSWEASWHKISRIDSEKNTVLLKTPARYPVGYFSVKAKYRIENLKRFLKSDGDWCYDENSGYIYYYAATGSDPNKKEFYVPALTTLIIIRGTETNPVVNLKFSGLNFRHTNSEWAVNTITKPAQDANKMKFPWLDFSTGFVSAQGAFASGQAILTLYSQKCVFDSCNFSGLDNYAIRIGEYSSSNSIRNCVIHDCGSGGVIVGFDDTDPIAKNKPAQISPSNNKLTDNTIYNLGLLHPSGIGVAILQANHTTVVNNSIYNLPYSGISSGWTFDDRANFTSNNVIKNNVIHDVMKDLADGGGIYTTGTQKGTVIKGNYIYNIKRSPDAIGSKSNGLFFDQYSSGLKADSNIIMSTTDGEVRFNRSDSTGILGKNYLEKTQRNMQILRKMNKNNHFNIKEGN